MPRLRYGGGLWCNSYLVRFKWIKRVHGIRSCECFSAFVRPHGVGTLKEKKHTFPKFYCLVLSCFSHCRVFASRRYFDWSIFPFKSSNFSSLSIWMTFSWMKPRYTFQPVGFNVQHPKAELTLWRPITARESQGFSLLGFQLFFIHKKGKVEEEKKCHS